MKENNYIAVITGDIIRSSKLRTWERKKMLEKLKRIFAAFKEDRGTSHTFSIYRGDSFQGIVQEPEKALQAGLWIRSELMKTGKDQLSYDCRMAIGLGKITYMAKNSLESDGDAFRNSGPALDIMNNEERLKIVTPWAEMNEEMLVACTIMDAVLKRWTAVQAGIISEALKGETQASIATLLKISQPAVSRSLKISGWAAIEELIKRYKTLIKRHI